MKWVGALLLGLGVSLGTQAQLSIPGQHGVSPSGGGTYSIPIQVPPGVAGIEPRLSLEYNTQSGNGLLGVGWKLSGLSSIARCPQTLSQDGVRKGVTFTSTDKFCLDGKRLMLVSGTYGAAGSVYQTEIESFVQITAVGAVSGVGATGPASFSVKTKDGLVMEYGATTDSRIQVASNLSTVRVWALNKLIDAKGNYLSVTYTKDCADKTNSTTCASTFNGGYMPAAIEYTRNDTQTPNLAAKARVAFDYDYGRSDAKTSYQAGYKFYERARLISIATFSNSVGVLAYDLSGYEVAADSGRSRLKSIKLCDKDKATCVASTAMTFTGASLGAGPVRAAYQQTSLDTALVSTAGLQANVGIRGGAEWLVGDFRGVGHSDLLHLSGTDAGSPSTAKLWSYNGSGAFSVSGPVSGIVLSQDVMPACTKTAQPSHHYYGMAKWGAQDINGDGLSDVILTTFYYQVAWASDCVGHTWWYKHINDYFTRSSGGSSFVWTNSLGGPYDFTNGFTNGGDTPPAVRSGILYGDMYGGLVANSITYDSWTPSTVYIDETAVTGFGDNPSASLAANNVAGFTIDLNGDGLLDVLRFEDNAQIAWLNTSVSGAPAYTVKTLNPSVADATKGAITTGFAKGQWLTADLNGDGLIDLIHIPQTTAQDSRQSGNLQWWINKGDGTFVAGAAANATDTFTPQTGTWQVVDYNGDGQADLLHLADAATGKIYRWSFGGAAFNVAVLPSGSGATDQVHTGASGGIWKAVDLIGDGTVDLVHLKDDSGNYVVWQMPRPDLDIPASIDNGVGKSMSFSTKTLPEMLNKDATNGGSYTRDTPTGAPATTTTLVPAMRVVSGLKVSDGLGGFNQIGYNYDSLRVERMGRGMLGFSWIESVDKSTGLTSRTTFSQSFPYIGMPVKVTTGTSHLKPDNLSQQINTVNAYCQASGTTNATLNTTTVCTTGVTGDGKRRYYPYVSASLTKTWDLDGTALPQASTAYTSVDEYGNIQQIKTSTLDGSGGSTSYSKQTNYTFFNDATNWLLGKVVKKVDTATGPDLPAAVVPVAPQPVVSTAMRAALLVLFMGDD